MFVLSVFLNYETFHDKCFQTLFYKVNVKTKHLKKEK